MATDGDGGGGTVVVDGASDIITLTEMLILDENLKKVNDRLPNLGRVDQYLKQQLIDLEAERRSRLILVHPRKRHEVASRAGINLVLEQSEHGDPTLDTKEMNVVARLSVVEEKIDRVRKSFVYTEHLIGYMRDELLGLQEDKARLVNGLSEPKRAQLEAAAEREIV